MAPVSYAAKGFAIDGSGNVAVRTDNGCRQKHCRKKITNKNVAHKKRATPLTKAAQLSILRFATNSLF